ncbi:hypothetical protein CSA56_05025 [candidate division KSB3 bacterium]|uniref:histidine kinase n=1 Tax=candidate division KSB3 bacterium TaxID=2044937 RepID=A0A2G6KHV7_9BACT|nr:MAG: hypothetical protein CSA56_05025 [candidate division KSB3 bacterium]
MTFDRTPFIEKFTQEAKELIQKLNEGLIALEKSPCDQEILKDLLRASHTLKGSSNILRFQRVTQLSHKIEDLLISVQDGQLSLNDTLIELLFRGVDGLGHCIDAIALDVDDAIDTTEICDILDRVAREENLSFLLSRLSSSSPRMAPHPTDSAAPRPSPDDPDKPVVTPGAPPRILDTIRVGVDSLDSAIRLIGEVSVSHRKSAHILRRLKELQRLARLHARRLSQFLLEEQSPDIHQTARHTMKTSLLQESLHLLQGIEMAFKEQRDEVASMDIVLSELHEGVLNMRMLPLAVIFDTFPRAVRDMSRYFHKEITLNIAGDETILDKKIIEKLDGPLIHILRNCIDHGIESPEERQAHGKPRNGRIDIRAFQKSGHITIEITDDGRGIQIEQLKERAIQRGMLSAEKVLALSDAELIELVFLPRLSTNEMITDISGRGIGMDIVKANIESLKGSVILTTEPNKGTSCTLTLPVTLSAIRSLIISSHHTLFAIPINTIEETLPISPNDYIQVVGHHAVRVRNQIVYVVGLGKMLNLPSESSNHAERHFLLIARIHGKRIGLIVDDILDEQDVVVKQLPNHMRAAKMIAGATISSNNAIILILHIPEILERVKHVTRTLPLSPVSETDANLPSILVVDDSVNTGEIEKRILEAYGYHVDVAHDGIEALEKLECMPYDLVVTDIEMPKMNGFTLTERLRQSPKYKELPVIIVTSLEREADRQRGLQVGANAYIAKGSFEQRSLIETVRSLL